MIKLKINEFIRIVTVIMTTLVLIGTIIEIYKLLRTKKKALNKFKNGTNNILLLENKANEEVQVIEENNIEDLQLGNDETAIVENDSNVLKKDYKTIKKESIIVKDVEKKS